ncbi:MAG: NAD(P)H-dependent oxidoreductase [Castellaniella sp.]
MSDSPHKTLIIVWHSRTGAARQMAQAARDGAHAAARLLEADARFTARLCPASQVQPEDLLQADGYLFCAPENLAALSGAMKECFDRNYYAVLDQLNGRPYALLISAGSDGRMAAQQATRICTGWRLRPALPPLIVNLAAQTPQAILAPKTLPEADRQASAEAGATLAGLLLL